MFTNVCGNDHGTEHLSEIAKRSDKALFIFYASNAALDELLSNTPLQGGVSYFRRATQPVL